MKKSGCRCTHSLLLMGLLLVLSSCDAGSTSAAVVRTTNTAATHDLACSCPIGTRANLRPARSKTRRAPVDILRARF